MSLSDEIASHTVWAGPAGTNTQDHSVPLPDAPEAHASATQTAEGSAVSGAEIGSQGLQAVQQSAPEHSYDFNAMGLQLGEHDRPVIDGFAVAMAKHNAPPEIIGAAWTWYTEQIAAQARQQEFRDQQAAGETGELLRAEWGEGEYATNRELIRTWISEMPGSLQRALRTATNDDGIPIFSDPDALRWLAKAARRGAPTSQYVSREAELAALKQAMSNPREWSKDLAGQARYRDLTRDGVQAGSGPLPSGSAGVEGELAQLKSMMSNKRSAYWKGPNAELFQARYRALVMK